ncbi:hypothetical protein [Anaerosphaera multitolerans]|uniref:Uncharacterized protein n=1 Tax=Anaerosphaera multitolerans TaxID=2487351 RepID=A0A437S5M2_9FIRM|nr:hypothetical protein [Anaerosphaera multitolerans]RVU54310.1 hypothetical protein EF514_08400 [Anaerosphaera multitolerans]
MKKIKNIIPYILYGYLGSLLYSFLNYKFHFSFNYRLIIIAVTVGLLSFILGKIKNIMFNKNNPQ